MSLKGSKKLETNRYELDITISGESFSDAIKKVYQKNVKKISVPGFRKGKAPLSIIESMYGESFFYEDARNGNAAWRRGRTTGKRLFTAAPAWKVCQYPKA